VQRKGRNGKEIKVREEKGKGKKRTFPQENFSRKIMLLYAKKLQLWGDIVP